MTLRTVTLTTGGALSRSSGPSASINGPVEANNQLESKTGLPCDTAGGALSRSSGPSASRNELVRVPTPSLGADLGQLLTTAEGADCEFLVEDEVRVAVSQKQGKATKSNFESSCSGGFVCASFVLCS